MSVSAPWNASWNKWLRMIQDRYNRHFSVCLAICYIQRKTSTKNRIWLIDWHTSDTKDLTRLENTVFRPSTSLPLPEPIITAIQTFHPVLKVIVAIVNVYFAVAVRTVFSLKHWKTVLDGGLTSHRPWRPWLPTLIVNSTKAMVMTNTHAKGQGQRSLGSKVRVETDERTDGGDCITFRANAVDNR